MSPVRGSRAGASSRIHRSRYSLSSRTDRRITHSQSIFVRNADWHQSTSTYSSPGGLGSAFQTPERQTTTSREKGAADGSVPSYGMFSDETNGSLDHVVMAIDKSGHGSIGCAYYVAREQTLRCMEDAREGGIELFDTLKLEIQPTVLLVSSRIQDDNLVQKDVEFSEQVSFSGTADEGVALPYKLERRPGTDFRYQSAVQKLCEIQRFRSQSALKFLVPGHRNNADADPLAEEVGLTDEQGKILELSSWLNMDSKVSIGCAGAVMAYLNRKRASDFLHDDPDAHFSYQIIRIEMFSLSGTMHVNTDTLASLQMVQLDRNPCTTSKDQQKSGSKISSSIYGLFSRFTKTPHGKSRLRRMFLRPSIDVKLIESRHNFVFIFSMPANQSILRDLTNGLSKVRNMRNVTALLHRGIEAGSHNTKQIKSGVWQSLLDFCYHTMDIVENLSNVHGAENLDLCFRIREAFSRTRIQWIGKTIFETVDLEESEQQHRTVIKRDVDTNLDTVKDTWDNMDETLSRVANDIVRQFPANTDVPLNVIFYPQLGFHIAIAKDPMTGDVVYDGTDQMWEMIFTTDVFVFYKNEKMREMDDQLGDLWGVVCDKEIEVSHELAQRVLQYEGLLVKISDLCSELDSLLALAHGVIQYNLVRPRMTREDVIEIEAGRHLLQETCVRSFVPNDTYLAGGRNEQDDGVEGTETASQFFPSTSNTCTSTSTYHPSSRPRRQNRHPNMILLTGPNFSGKSIYLKQVAIIVCLAQIGSFVPATSARLGITDKIFTRISTRETVSKAQSTFMIDLQQIAVALHSYTPRSLLVIDEFGKGTDPCDGAGLLAGVLEHLLQHAERGEAPKILASTHLHEIFEQCRLEERFPSTLACMQMEIHIEKRQVPVRQKPVDQSFFTLPGEKRGTDVDDGRASVPTSTVRVHDLTTATAPVSGTPHASEVIYLYNVRPGRNSTSYGTQCAAMNGVPTGIVARAQQLSEAATRGEDLVSMCASTLSAAEGKELELAEKIAREFLAWDLRNVDVGVGDGEDAVDLRAALKELLMDRSEEYDGGDGSGESRDRYEMEEEEEKDEDVDGDVDEDEDMSTSSGPESVRFEYSTATAGVSKSLPSGDGVDAIELDHQEKETFEAFSGSVSSEDAESWSLTQ